MEGAISCAGADNGGGPGFKASETNGTSGHRSNPIQVARKRRNAFRMRRLCASNLLTNILIGIGTVTS